MTTPAESPDPSSGDANDIVEAHAFPRAGILGNPSDLYGGRGVGFTFSNYRATVRLEPHGASAEPSAEMPLLWATREVVRRTGHEDALRTAPFVLTFRSDIPRQAGLSGSSAIIIAALRAIAEHAQRNGVVFAPTRAEIADMALRAETEVLGTTAGPMDRVVQAHEGLLAMDFAEATHERLDAALMPPVVLLIDLQPGEDSGIVHTPVRERWERGDPEVRRVMAAYRPLVARGLDALRRGDRLELARCIDENFDLRASVFHIERRDEAMVDYVRSVGAAAKFCGSGGALLVLPPADGGPVRARLRAHAVEEGWAFVDPVLARPGD